MTVEDSTFKLTVFKEFPFEELKRIVDRIETIGYKATFTENGNIVFAKVKE